MRAADTAGGGPSGGAPRDVGAFAMLRAQAAARFGELSWPGAETEEWRRTDLAKLGLDELARASLSGGSLQAGLRLHAVDEAALRAGLSVAELSAALGGTGGSALVDSLARGLELSDRIGVWHYAALQGGLVLRVPEGVELAEPIIVELAGGEGAESALASQHLVLALARGSRATVVLRLSDPSIRLSNLGIDIRIEDGAALEFGMLQDLGPGALDFSTVRARLGRDASLRSFDARFGGALAVSSVECDLDGPGSDAILDGAFLGARGKHLDLRTVQRHNSPRASSRALYKGAVEPGGRSVFQGLIEVAKGAAGTDAYLANRNLVLGPGARADSIPTLRIGNDDVRCSHGSATGRLSDEELFYLRSRGFPLAEARSMLVAGFFEELAARAPRGLGEELVELVARRIARDGAAAA